MHTAANILPTQDPSAKQTIARVGTAGKALRKTCLLLEPDRHGRLVGEPAQPDRQIARRARGQRDHIVAIQPTVAAQLGQREATDIVGLGQPGQPREMDGRARRRGIYTEFRQQRPVAAIATACLAFAVSNAIYALLFSGIASRQTQVTVTIKAGTGIGVVKRSLTITVQILWLQQSETTEPMSLMHCNDTSPLLAGEILSPRRAFDYSALPATIATHVRAAADRIRARHQNQIIAMIETGYDLLAIKKQFKHGQFSAWLHAEFAMTERTAQKYMRAATELGTKTEIISDLPMTTVHTLSAPSTPVPVRQAVVTRLEAGERLDGSEVESLVRDAKAAERRAKEEAKLAPRQRKKREQHRAEMERRQQERERKQQARDVAARTVAQFLAAKLGADLPTFLAQSEQADMWDVMRLLQNMSQNE
jgi:hypothetical protein